MNRIIMPEKLICGYFDSKIFGTALQSAKRTATLFEIEIVTENGFSSFINSEEIAILKNRIIITKPGDERYSLLHFKTMFIKFPAEEKLAEMLSNLPRYFYATHIERLKELLHEIIFLKESSQPDCLLINGKILEFLSLLISDAKNSTTVNGYDYNAIQHSKKFITEHFEEKISTADIAKAVNLSESYFRYIFRASLGITPHQFLINTRIEAAKQMLWLSDVPMFQIAEKCGFSCQQNFSNVFKKETGMTASEYRIQFAKRYTI